MTEIAGVYPKVRIEAPGAPDILVEDVVADSMKDFFRESEVWRYSVPSLLDWTQAQTFPTLTPGSEIPAGTRMKRLDELKYGKNEGRIVPFYTRQDMDCVFPIWETKTGSAPLAWTNDPTSDSPRIIPIATADVTGSLFLRVILVPTTLTDIPDFFYDEFHDVWRWGALARLLKMPGRDWTNLQLAAYYRALYDDEIVRAKSRAQAEFGQPNKRLMAYGGI
jgi:hypothetical protein